MEFQIPSNANEFTIRTWSWHEERKPHVIRPGDQIVIDKACTWERMCYHSMTLNGKELDGRFCSDDIVRLCNSTGVPVPKHFRPKYERK